jgi:hypothetical protein
MRGPHLDLAKARMQPRERVRILGRSDLGGRQGFVVGPQRDGEAVANMDIRLHPRLKHSHRAPGFGETASNHDLEVVIGGAIRE